MDKMSKALSYICTEKKNVTHKAEEWEKIKKKRERNTNSNDTNELLKQSVAYTKQQSTFF